MLRLFLTAWLALLLFGSGCSAISDFGGYEKASEENPDAGGEAGEGAKEDGGGAGAAGDGAGGTGGPGDGGAAGAAGDGGEGDGQIGSRCTRDDDCAEGLACRGGVCAEPEPPGAVVRTGQFISSGGGTTSSRGYTITITIGVPQSAGASSSENYTIHLGPRAGQ
jgi:hypothetical protein